MDAGGVVTAILANIESGDFDITQRTSRGGGQIGKIKTYYGSPMVRPAPGGPGDLRPSPKGKLPKTYMA